MIQIRNENDYSILRRAEDMLDTTFDWNIKDDEMTGFANEDELEIIDELCSEIDRLKEELEDIQEEHRQEISDFYNPKSPYEIYGINEDIFH